MHIIIAHSLTYGIINTITYKISSAKILMKHSYSIRKIILHLLNKKIFHVIPDKQYLKIRYFVKMGKKLNLDTPKTFNEKLQWIKLYDRKDIYTIMVDKAQAKEYVKNIIGEEYIIPTLGIYDNFDEINFDKLPNKFVIKCTHDSGGLVICRDKTKLDKQAAKKKINKALQKIFYYSNREWPYKNVPPKIIIEKYMEDKNNKSMQDYKFFCFNGEPKIMYISEGLENHATARMSFYDMDMQLTSCLRRDYKPLNFMPKKPKNFEKMKQFSALLSKDIAHMRVDWYEINGKLYFGELTLTTCGGMMLFEDDSWDYKLGELINLDIHASS